MNDEHQNTSEEKPITFYYPERALVIVAHADDIEFGASGTAAKWTDAGTEVTYVIVTNNSSGSNEPDADLDELIATREREQRESAAVVGVTDVRFLGYQDGVLQPSLTLRKDLTRIIREVRPQVVVTMDFTTIFANGGSYINHPDHRAVGEAATYAVFPSSETRPIFPDLLEEGLEPHKVNYLYYTLVNAVDLHVDISDVIERKQEALRCHKSQLTEEAVQMVTKWNAEAGKAINAGYAESFRVLTLNEPESNTDSE